LDFEIYLRQTYGLLYAIKELITQNPRVRPQPPKADLEELKRVCEFRHALVVHEHDMKRYGRGTKLGLLEDLDLRIGVSLGPMSDDDARLLSAVFARAAPGLPEEVRDTQNENERLAILYEHLTLVPGEDQRHVKGLIARNGVKSDAPATLALLVREL